MRFPVEARFTCAVELVSRGRGFLELDWLATRLLPLFYFTWTVFSVLQGKLQIRAHTHMHPYIGTLCSSSADPLNRLSGFRGMRLWMQKL
jgi:hypothetical protein